MGQQIQQASGHHGPEGLNRSLWPFSELLSLLPQFLCYIFCFFHFDSCWNGPTWILLSKLERERERERDHRRDLEKKTIESNEGPRSKSNHRSSNRTTLGRNPTIEARIEGDIHDQYQDHLLRLFEYGGFPSDANYLFLGDCINSREAKLGKATTFQHF
ncbi:hypothetical protein Vadar_007249 [Vaccinium darrowii]|uniref:Uncharacterized protein n=1 Tax=Vaccinium darrowii TaxID=229202 RepID=A0ACB7YKE1_9ERIC|nr:hypothetical protein Vadar_007249 [Vaccinium darrowii]